MQTARSVLGIDPGTRATGYAVLATGKGPGRKLELLESGTIRLDVQEDLALRLATLQREIDAIITRNAPSVVAVEDVFCHRNVRSALLLGHARGAVLAAVAAHGLAVSAYPPATVKRAVAGHGRADKDQMRRMVQAAMGLTYLPQADEADAIAIAACHVMCEPMQNQLRQAQQRVSRKRVRSVKVLP